MYTTEDNGTEGLPRQTTTGSAGAADVHRVQETRWADDRAPKVLPRQASTDGASGAGDRLDEALRGFMPKEWVPHSYQERGVEWLATRPEGALFLPPGMGKSSISLAAFLLLREMRHAKRMLILAPLTVCLTTWMTEPNKWRQFQGLKIGVAHGPDKKLILNDEYYDIVVMNYDGIEWSAPMLAQGHKFDILLCDELTKLKNHSSKRFKAIKPVLPTFKFRWGLTGTPIANGFLDLFGEMYTLDLGKRLGQFVTHYRLKYFYQKPWDHYRYFITPEKSGQIIEKIQDCAMYMDPKDWLALPPLLPITIPVQLAPKELAEYKSLEQEFILKIMDDTVLAANAGVLTSKLRQFVSGGIYLTPDTWILTSNAKLDALKDLVEGLNGEPLLVAYQFNHELERLKKAFPDSMAIKGGMSGNELTKIVGAWNAGEVPVLFVQPAAAAHGLNLQFGGSAICWFSLTYNLEEYLQLIARVYRQGQKDTVRNHILSATGTIDEVLSTILIRKDTTQESLFKALKTYALCITLLA